MEEELLAIKKYIKNIIEHNIYDLKFIECNLNDIKVILCKSGMVK